MKKILTALALVATAITAPVAAQKPVNSYTYQVIGYYDGDTFFIRMSGLPPELSRISVRIRGIDTPEIRGKCEFEKRTAAQAAAFLERYIRQNGGTVTLTGLRWDKYGGRVDADVFVNGKKVADEMILRELARPYTGGKRKGWCPNG